MPKSNDTLEAFVNPDLASIYSEIDINVASFEDALKDITQEHRITVLYADFANGFPFITPRETETLTPGSNTHDFLCNKVYEQVGVHSSRLSHFQIVDHPLYFLELFDQIDHRREGAARVLNSRNKSDMYSAILDNSKTISGSRIDVELLIAQKIENVRGTKLAANLEAYKERVHSGAIRSLFDYVDRGEYYALLKDEDKYNTFLNGVDEFRRPSSASDPADAEMHRQIDAMMVLTTAGMSRHRDKFRLCYWGQERLRRIFGPRMRELSRDAASPRIIQQALMEVSYDRHLLSEAIYNIKRRATDLKNIRDDLYSMRGSPTIPITLAKACLVAENDFGSFVLGGAKMIKPDEYNDLLRQIIDRPTQIKEAFEQVASEAETASNIVKQLAASSLNREAQDLLMLRPNARIMKLLDDLTK